MRTILAVGRESADGAALEVPYPTATTAELGQSIHHLMSSSPEADDLELGAREPICIVPMTLGRDPVLIADTARAARWLRDQHSAPVCVSEPFGSPAHLITWLRAALTKQSGPADDKHAVLVIGPSIDPFQDAQLFRIARLVRQHSGYPLVEVAFDGGDPDPYQGLQRCQRLGAEQVIALNASWNQPEDRPDQLIDGGRLLGAQAVQFVLRSRIADAQAAWDRGDDGIAAGLLAGHDDGFAHSHGSDHEHPHSHEHEHPHEHPHDHGHSHTHQHRHAHSGATYLHHHD
ncbi:hypothetical protein [Devriesea agamarum]|uniref:hypothetical protein n=1 Tax=Devriesea agamarum TaxID=472569 RepID=UPI00071E58FB|nr:hypothetical protein [Devriesea agamarum]